MTPRPPTGVRPATDPRTAPAATTTRPGGGFRWRLADEEPTGQAAMFTTDEVLTRITGTGRLSGLEFLHVNARRIINEVPSESRMPFRHTINAYRGCSHACTYCFARPTHAWLGLDTGRDFERKIVVKINAVERLRVEISAARWAGDPIAMGTNTDPYQRCEGKYELTRGLLRVLGDAGNPFSILTKSPLVLRDLDLLTAAARRAQVTVNLSIGTLDRDLWRASEPGAPDPRRRVEAVRRLTEAGIRCGVLIAPVIPGLSDGEDQLAAVVDAVVDAGAVSVGSVALHLRPGVREHALGWLARYRPNLVAEYTDRYRRSYLPDPERKAISMTVNDLVARARARSAGRPVPATNLPAPGGPEAGLPTTGLPATGVPAVGLPAATDVARPVGA
ncbi:MAG: radical SAM protein [Frankia sp.]